jgi:two-component system OmpR family sensor kinase
MGLVAVLLVVAAALVVRTTTAQLLDQVDAQLARVASGGGPGFGPDRARRPPRGEVPEEFQDELQDDEYRDDLIDELDDLTTVYMGVFYDDELVDEVVPAIGDDKSPVPQLDADDANELAETGVAETVESTVEGVRYRVIAGMDARSGMTVVYGLPLDNVDSSVHRLVLVEAVTIGGVLMVLAVITWWVTRLGVAPIRRMTAAATTIAGGDLSARVPEAPAGTEAGELGDALNVMLERIEAAFAQRAASEERLRQFVADASHELRTPVTTVRGYAELYRMGGLDDPGKLDAAMTRTEAESVRMGRLVDDMLTLARLDRGAAPVATDVRLDTVVADAVADVRVVHPDHPVTVSLEPVVVRGSQDQLHQVVANLLANAAVHTPPGTAVRVGLTSAEGAVRLVVADDGPGMDDAAAAHAFERFFRADPSRSRASGGSGLGLSIVAAIVSSLGGQVHLARGDDPSAAGTGTTVVVELPAAAA